MEFTPSRMGTATSASPQPRAEPSRVRFYGIEAASFGTGSISVTTALNDVVTSASVGLNVYNQATAVPQSGGATVSNITVTSNGTINSGALPTGNGARPAGILAGYGGSTTPAPNANVFGNVTVNNSASINAVGGDEIRGYNYGGGNVNINQSNTTITADTFGIDAVSYGVGNVSISMAAGAVVNAGSSGLQAINLATAISGTAPATVAVTAHGTINTGTNLTSGGSQPQGISAGYLPGNSQTTNNNVNGAVTVDNFANVTAAAGYGINAYNFGDGSIGITDKSGTTVSGALYGIQAFSQGTVSGNVTVTVNASATINAGSLYGLAGINAVARNPGNVAITTSTGDIINSGGIGIQANNSSIRHGPQVRSRSRRLAAASVRASTPTAVRRLVFRRDTIPAIRAWSIRMCRAMSSSMMRQHHCGFRLRDKPLQFQRRFSPGNDRGGYHDFRSCNRRERLCAGRRQCDDSQQRHDHGRSRLRHRCGNRHRTLDHRQRHPVDHQ